jgi:hypothetical protein
MKKRMTATSLRESDFYIEYVDSFILDNKIKIPNTIKNISIKKRKRYESIDDKLEYINGIIDNVIFNKKSITQERNEFSASMKQAFQETQLTKDQFSWLDMTNERLCNWVWCFLNLEVQHITSEDIALYLRSVKHKSRNVDFELINYLPKKPLTRKTFNCAERITSIKQTFNDSEICKKDQERLISLIKKLWLDICEFQSFVTWLDTSNTIQVKWAWNYLSSKEIRISFKPWKAAGHSERAAAIIAAIDMGIYRYEDRTKLLLFNMKKAWSQKKFRDKSNGKKAYSISMTPKTKKQLDCLAEQKELKINETIAQLIQNEFEKINSRSQP